MERLGEELRSSETATQTKGRARDRRRTKSLSKAAIRKLWSVETDAYRDHLLRLDPESWHSRFGAAIADDMIQTYAATAPGISYARNEEIFGEGEPAEY